MERIKVGVIGAGRIGKLHSENIINSIRSAELVAIADPYLDETWAKEKGIDICTKDHLGFTKQCMKFMFG